MDGSCFRVLYKMNKDIPTKIGMTMNQCALEKSIIASSLIIPKLNTLIHAKVPKAISPMNMQSPIATKMYLASMHQTTMPMITYQNISKFTSFIEPLLTLSGRYIVFIFPKKSILEDSILLSCGAIYYFLNFFTL